MSRVVVVGGGIAGLTALYRLTRGRSAAAVLLEQEQGRLGGKLRSERRDGFVLEAGADSFLSRKPAAVALCRELGIEGEMIGRRPEHQGTFVRRAGTLYPLPEGLTGFVPTNLEALSSSSLLSAAGKERLGREPEIPADVAMDESIADFMRRRLGAEAYDYIVEPLMAGIYGGNGEELSLLATFPQLRELERRHGSLLRGLESSSSPRDDLPAFVSFSSGIERLVEAVVEKLPEGSVRSGVSVTAVEKSRQGFEVETAEGRIAAEAVILAVPAFVAGKLVESLDADLAADLEAIPYGSAATVNLAYTASTVPAFSGYGYVVPRVESQVVLACTCSSNKWPARSPEDSVLFRVFLGRVGGPDVVGLDDDELIALARRELRKTLGIEASPGVVSLSRWPRGMPQYTMGHLDRRCRIDERLTEHPGLILVGAAYRGVGIPDCIASADRGVQALSAFGVSADSR